MALTDELIDEEWFEVHHLNINNAAKAKLFARAIESAACAERDARIAELLANEKVLLSQVQGHTEWRERIVKASEQAYGESAVRYKFSLTKAGKCMNTFPKEIDGRWFALVPAEDDGHIGHIARIAELERQLAEAHKALHDAATSLNTIGDLAGYHTRGGIETLLDTFQDVRFYAKSRHRVAREAINTYYLEPHVKTAHEAMRTAMQKG